MKGGHFHLRYFFGAATLQKKNCKCIHFLNSFCLEAISLILVANILLVLMLPLKSNYLLISGYMSAISHASMFTQFTCPKKLSTLWFGRLFLDGVGNIGSW